jgi:hypothetical protein
MSYTKYMLSLKWHPNGPDSCKDGSCVEDIIIYCFSFVSWPLVSLNFDHDVGVEFVEVAGFVTVDESIRVDIIVYSCIKLVHPGLWKAVFVEFLDRLITKTQMKIFFDSKLKKNSQINLRIHDDCNR